MIGGLDQKDLLRSRINTDIGENIGFECLRPVGVEDHLDIRAFQTNDRRRSECDAALAKALPTFHCGPKDLDASINGRAAIRPRFTAKTQLDKCTLARCE